jgi:hypothetical protein
MITAGAFEKRSLGIANDDSAAFATASAELKNSTEMLKVAYAKFPQDARPIPAP